jgi:hypothetical protein
MGENPYLKSKIFDVVKKRETFNPERFAKALQELPKLPQD